jgi:hypothetical protein
MAALLNIEGISVRTTGLFTEELAPAVRELAAAFKEDHERYLTARLSPTPKVRKQREELNRDIRRGIASLEAAANHFKHGQACLGELLREEGLRREAGE